MSKETIFGIVINVCFVLTIFAVRYYFVKQEYDFLVNDSQRQEELIVENEFTIDTLKTEVAKLNKYNVKLINEMQDVKTNYYERIRWEKEYEQRLKNLRESLDSVKFEVSLGENGLIPFEKEFGVQDNYLRIFGRTGVKIKDNKILDSKTDLSFDGEIKMGAPEIEKLGEYEFKAVLPSKSFDGLRLSGGESKPIALKPPRNQISFGPMLGVTYNSITGLTEPIWGFGITYNLVKLWDWK
jgi:hypothetical protein|tara:strand:+ start:374 stop:1093 length:720 start_codon:yes stop_codon:yes gene_type:complete